MAAKNICIVTPDLIGPVNNGGIGTHAHYLSRALAASHRVTILYTGPMNHGNAGHWQKFYARWKVSFEPLPPEKRRYTHMRTDAIQSLAVYAWLKDKNFDAIHFQDWKADGFHAIQAKRTVGSLAHCLLTVTMHSSTQWIDSGMKQWTPYPLLMTTLSWMERYCHLHCDVLLSPSRYMFGWALNQGWELAERRRLLPNCFLPEESEAHPPDGADHSHLVFFGRLETRKGLEVFCDAVSSLLDQGYDGLSRVTFLGRHHQADNQNSRRYLEKIQRKWNGRLAVAVKSDLDSFQAREFLRQSGAVAVMPSLVDNFPYTVVECVEQGVPFIASNAGGIGEIAGDGVLFDPNAPALAARIRSLPDLDFSAVAHKYNAQAAEAAWLALHDEESARPEGGPAAARGEEPKVSICVSHYNYGQYLPQLLASIEANDYGNYEVIVVDDGSTDPFSQKVFSDLANAARAGRVFHQQENGGIGAARNKAASLAQGDFLIFMDSDNCARPRMISAFVRAMLHSGLDCLTCHFRAFEGPERPGEATKTTYRYAPLGACLEAGMLENVFGDANFIIKKTVFQQMGGFSLQRNASWEDYEFLARLCLEGYSLDVIPEELFWYRHTGGGFSRVTNLYTNHLRIADTYSGHLPPYMNFMIKNWIIPSFYLAEAGGRLWRLAIRLLPPDTARGRLARAVYQFLKNRSLI